MIAPKGGLRSRWRKAVSILKSFLELTLTVATALGAVGNGLRTAKRLQRFLTSCSRASSFRSRLKTSIKRNQYYASVRSHFSSSAKSKAINCGSKWKARNSPGQLPIFLTIGGIQLVEWSRVIRLLSALQACESPIKKRGIECVQI